MESLRQELLNAQQTRDNFMKWKLALVSAIGAAALGFSKAKEPVENAEWALCLIPFACCYVDLLCRNLSIRTKLLSKFLSELYKENPENLTARYEELYQKFDAKRVEQGKDALEGFALIGSTRVLSLSVILLGVFISYPGWSQWCKWLWSSIPFIASGVVGLLVSLKVEDEYGEQKKAIEEMNLSSEKEAEQRVSS